MKLELWQRRHVSRMERLEQLQARPRSILVLLECLLRLVILIPRLWWETKKASKRPPLRQF